MPATVKEPKQKMATATGPEKSSMANQPCQKAVVLRMRASLFLWERKAADGMSERLRYVQLVKPGEAKQCHSHNHQDSVNCIHHW